MGFNYVNQFLVSFYVFIITSNCGISIKELCERYVTYVFTILLIIKLIQKIKKALSWEAISVIFWFFYVLVYFSQEYQVIHSDIPQ